MKILYYSCWAVVFFYLFAMVVGTVAKHGWGPLILAGTLGAALAGIYFLHDRVRRIDPPRSPPNAERR